MFRKGLLHCRQEENRQRASIYTGGRHPALHMEQEVTSQRTHIAKQNTFSELALTGELTANFPFESLFLK